MSEARRIRRKNNRTYLKQVQFIKQLDIPDTYIKIKLGLSDLSESKRKLFIDYVNNRRCIDKMFDKLISELDVMIMNAIKKSSNE